MISMKVINEFYAAYAIRHFVSHEDIIGEAKKTFEEAEEYANSFLCDDDDSGVFTNVDNKWYRVWGRDEKTGTLIISEEYAGWIDAAPVNWM